VSPAEEAARELFAFHNCIWMSPEDFAEALGIHCNTVLRAIRGGELEAIACGGGDDSTLSKPYRIFRCHTARFFAKRNTGAAVRPATIEDSPAAKPHVGETPAMTAPQTAPTPRPGRSQRRPTPVALVATERR
jgi:hypothetical protein